MPSFVGRLRARLARLAWPGRRLSFAAAGLLGASAVAHGQVVAPAHWVAYAQRAGATLQARLADDTRPPAHRLHDWMEHQQAAGGARPVVLSIWIGADGRISRAAFDSLGNAQADADLRAVLAAEPLHDAPPRDMQQPLVLQLLLQANPDYAAPATRVD